ncbi:MAG: protein translocase subunit SecF, partial [Candidatus Aminicenantes bacterium]|nr:protein translocase subunit SecF [Candidatus Aminicenantes bacterium]
TMIEVSFRSDIDIDYVRKALAEVGMGDSEIVRVKKENKFFIKTMAPVTGTKEKKEFDEHERKANQIREVFRTPEETAALEAGKIDLNNSGASAIANILTANGISLDDAEASAQKIIELRNKFRDKSGKIVGLITDFSQLEKLELKNRVLSVLKDRTFLGTFTFLSTEYVGPQVGQRLRGQAVRAALFALLGMLIYIAVRFKPVYGISGVLTLFHDVLVTLSFIIFFNIEMSLQVVAAILTIVGYSINDTIVVFDRVRDNVKLMRKENSDAILDLSINQTLSRSIVTSGTVLLTVLALFFFGGEVIYTFSFTMLVGVIAGSYSTIFQSCAWLKIWENSFLGRKKLK